MSDCGPDFQSSGEFPADPEARWPAWIALFASTGLYFALPPHLALGPSWLLLGLILLLSLPLIITHRRNWMDANYSFGMAVSSILTAFMVYSIYRLVITLPSRQQSSAPELLRSAALLWFSNILVFALWYWRLDAGGPHARERTIGHHRGSFLFPQMALDPDVKRRMCEDNWSPGFVDYLFLAFNTSTALSPADTSALSRWSKILMMVQATVSITIIALLAARAVNIL